MSTRVFHLGDVLSITTGFMVSPRRMDAYYDVLNFMTGDDLMTHQLVRGLRECQPELLRQHPDLADVQVPDPFRDVEHVWVWLAEQVVRYGETREVAPLPAGVHVRINPIVELAAMHSAPPIVFHVPREDRQ
jgi:hypothetical protein